MPTTSSLGPESLLGRFGHLCWTLDNNTHCGALTPCSRSDLLAVRPVSHEGTWDEEILIFDVQGVDEWRDMWSSAPQNQWRSGPPLSIRRAGGSIWLLRVRNDKRPRIKKIWRVLEGFSDQGVRGEERREDSLRRSSMALAALISSTKSVEVWPSSVNQEGGGGSYGCYA
jgi:hypothetical protein